jgi:uncharacterized membrane protein SirB2
MIDVDTPGLGRSRTAFALSAATTILFNTVVACVKDAYHPLKMFMASLSDSDWTTQGIADVVLFIVLGMILLKTGLLERINPFRVISFLVGSVIVAGVGLFAWYIFY